MTAFDYVLEVVGKENMKFLALTEDDALQVLIASHRRLRDDQTKQFNYWLHRPRWKGWLAKWLKVI